MDIYGGWCDEGECGMGVCISITPAGRDGEVSNDPPVMSCEDEVLISPSVRLLDNIGGG